MTANEYNTSSLVPCLCFAKTPCVYLYSHRDSNVETSFCSRNTAVHQLVVPEGDEVAAPARPDCVGSDDGLAVDLVLLLHCREAIPPNNARNTG